MEDKEYVGFWNRFHAVIVTAVLLGLIGMCISYILWGNFWMDDMELFDTEVIFVDYLMPMVVTIMLWEKFSSDPGKMLYRAKIVDATTYDKPTLKQFVIRYIGYYVSLMPLGLGYFWVIWDKRKQSWHDKMAHTLVLKPEQSSKVKWYVLVYRVMITLFMGLIVGVALSTLFISDIQILEKKDNLNKEKIEWILEHKTIGTIDGLIYMGESYSWIDKIIYNKSYVTMIDKNSICTFISQGKEVSNKDCYFFDKIKKLEFTYEKYEELTYILMYDAAVYSPDEYIGDGVSDGLHVYIMINTTEENEFNSTLMQMWKQSQDE